MNDDYKRMTPIVAERDDTDEGARGTRNSGRPQGKKEPSSQEQAQDSTRRSGGVSRVLPGLLVLAVIGLAAYALLLNQENVQTRTALDNLQARFEHLEEQITSTDESLSESGAAIQAKLREADSEIRKLWGVANDRNRKAIAANEETIKGLTTSVGRIEQAYDTQTGSIDALRVKVEGFDRALATANAEVLAAKAELEELGQLSQSLSVAMEQMEATAARLNSIENRVRTHDEVIQSIDAFRRQTNQSLLQIRQQLGTQ